MSYKAAIVNAVKKTTKGTVVTLEEEQARFEDSVQTWVPLPMWSLDYLVSRFRGWPTGKGSIIWGPESSGKSALTKYLAGCFAKANGTTGWLDFDQSFNPDQMKSYGIPSDQFLLIDADYAEEAVDAISGMVESIFPKGKKEQWGKDPLLLVWDSVASTGTAVQIIGKKSKSAEDVTVGAMSKVMATQLIRLRPMMKYKPVALVLIQEVRDNFNSVGFGAAPHTMPGGKALRHYGTIKLKLGLRETIKGTVNGREVPTQYKITMRAEKSRFGAEKQEASFIIKLDKEKGGVSTVLSNWHFAKDMNLFVPRGREVAFKDHASLGTFSQKDFGAFLKSKGKAAREAVVSLVSVPKESKK